MVHTSVHCPNNQKMKNNQLCHTSFTVCVLDLAVEQSRVNFETKKVGSKGNVGEKSRRRSRSRPYSELRGGAVALDFILYTLYFILYTMWEKKAGGAGAGGAGGAGGGGAGPTVN